MPAEPKPKRPIRPNEIQKLADRLGLGKMSKEQIAKIQQQENPREYMRQMRREMPRAQIIAEVKRLGLGRTREEINNLVERARRVTGLSATEYIQRVAAGRLASGNTKVNVEAAKKISLKIPVDDVDIGYSPPDAPAFVTKADDGEQMLEITIRIPLGDWERDGYGVSLQSPPTVLRMDNRLNHAQRVAVGRIALGQYRIKGVMNGHNITSKEQAVLRVLEMIGEEIAAKDAESREFMEAANLR